MTSHEKITVIIATIGRPDAVKRLVRSIQLRYPSVPILVGEQIDGTGSSELEGIDADVLRFPYDYGVSATRNALASHVSTDYFVLCDDDFIFGELTDISPATDILDSNEDIGVVGGLLFDVFDGDRINERSPRHWEKWLHLDKTRKTLTMAPIAYEFPEYSYIKSWRYLRADAVVNWAVMRTGLFRDGVLCWDAQFKIAGEHEDFYLRRKVMAPQVGVVYCPDLIAYHHSNLSWYGDSYRNLRSRLEGWAHFRNKWNIDRVIDIEEIVGNCIDTTDSAVHPAAGGYKLFMDNLNKRGGRRAIDRNSVGIDAKGNLYFNQVNYRSTNRVEDERLFLSETTRELRVARSAEFVTRMRAAGQQPYDVDMLVRENSYLRDRDIWTRLLFRPSGRPIRPLRRILFHNNGKPRGIFRKYVMRAAAKPGTALNYWMTHPAYLGLPRAVRLPEHEY